MTGGEDTRARETPARIALLPDRGVVRVCGDDAEKLLQGILTNDLTTALGTSDAMLAGLLTPQGKIMFELLVMRSADGFLIDVARDRTADLVKRLTMYRLRAKAEIEDSSSDLVVQAMWGSGARCDCNPGYRDPRHPALGLRIVSRREHAADDAKCSNGEETTAAAYHAHRVALGIAEGGKDYDFGDAFPHEANFDLDHGVSFAKGCYVGQEVVARMQHKTVVRKRVVRVSGASQLPADRPEIKAGDVVVGRLGSVSGRDALAMLRLDRVLEFATKGVPVSAAGILLDVAPDALDRYRTSAAAHG